MDKILALIEDLQNDIFAYRLDKFSQKMLQFVENLTTWVTSLSATEKNRLNTILTALLDSYGKKDYLLLADLLEFELKPLLTGQILEERK